MPLHTIFAGLAAAGHIHKRLAVAVIRNAPAATLQAEAAVPRRMKSGWTAACPLHMHDGSPADRSCNTGIAGTSVASRPEAACLRETKAAH